MQGRGAIGPNSWWAGGIWLAGILYWNCLAAEPSPPEVAIDAPVVSRYGTWALPWRTSHLKGTPEARPLVPSRVFPQIAFRNPTVLTVMPGMRRFVVGEQMGKVYSFSRDRESSQAELLLDVTQQLSGWPEGEQLEIEGLYGLAFDPDFPERPYIYVCYVARYRDSQRGQHPKGSRVSRFTIRFSEPPTADPQSELVIIEWLQGGHNGGCVKFGPDRCLYISTGDGGFAYPPDPLKAGQDVSNLLSAILRIDVREARSEAPYRIPPDNPLVHLPGARPEIWAYGLRNPWKMSFDRVTGDLWVGDVGWELWELVLRVRAGDNFGWSLVEGPQVVHTDRPLGPTPIVPPVMAVSHSDGASITGGFVYRGRKFPELYGYYIFGDWETRRVWAIREEKGLVTPLREIAEPTVRVVDFAEDEDGELYLLDYDEGTIHELVKNPAAASPSTFPRRLSQTGLFRSLPDQIPEHGVVPFQINAPRWADHAQAQRWVAVPDGQAIDVFNRPQPIPGSMFTRTMLFPPHSVLVKTYSIRMQEEDPTSLRHLETQVLYYDGKFWHGFSYWWNDEQTDAELVPPEGMERWLTVDDPRAPGGKRQQLWRVPSRQECIRCHNPWSEYALAFSVPQLNRSVFVGGSSVSQLQLLAEIGRLHFRDIAEAPFRHLAREVSGTQPWWERLPRLADPYDEAFSVEARARAYLHANCAHCHRFNGGGSAYFYLLYDLPLAECRAVEVAPTQGTFGIAQARLIAPGAPQKSVLLYRMSKTGSGRMPRLGSEEVDVIGLTLVEKWIEPLVSGSSNDLATVASRSAAMETEQLDYYFSSTDRAWQLMRMLDRGLVSHSVRDAVLRRAAQAEPVIRDLFERFQPPEARVKRLTTTLPIDRILQIEGSPDRGRDLFLQSNQLQCRRCHGIGEPVEKVGPDLAGIGNRRSRRQLLESLLDPSRNIEPKYLTWLLELNDGRVITGRLLEKTSTHYRVKTAANEDIEVAVDDVAQAQSQRISLMPEAQLQDVTIEQVADLLAFLASLKVPAP